MRTHFHVVERIFQFVGAAQMSLGLAFVFHDDDFAFGVLLMTLGLLTAMRPWRDRLQFNAGWNSGRATFVLSMLEAQQRGMRPHEWLIAEAERDGVLVVEREEDP